MSFSPTVVIPNVVGNFVALQQPGLYMFDASTLDQPATLRIASKATVNKYNFLVERQNSLNVAPINSIPQTDAIVNCRVTFNATLAGLTSAQAIAQVKQVYDFLAVTANMDKLLRGEI